MAFNIDAAIPEREIQGRGRMGSEGGRASKMEGGKLEGIKGIPIFQGSYPLLFLTHPGPGRVQGAYREVRRKEVGLKTEGRGGNAEGSRVSSFRGPGFGEASDKINWLN